ncbi:MAG: VWA domain-containing protein [Acidobacteriota bacterium]|nr:MAG: VWA domain-containing protein [Acidobacteriota bacterium]
MSPLKSGKIQAFVALFLGLSVGAFAQQFDQTYPLAAAEEISVVNEFGKISVTVLPADAGAGSLRAVSATAFSRGDVVVGSKKGKISIEVVPSSSQARIDLELSVPSRSSVKLESREGEIRFSGDFREISAETSSGTVIADLPTENLLYKFIWTAARPRILSDPDLAEPEEKNAGKTVIEGELRSDPSAVQTVVEVRTSRGILLLNVDPEQVPTSLSERPLTEAAKAMVRSGDVFLSEAIRRASPKYFGDYAATLPPRRTGPELVAAPERRPVPGGEIRTVNVQVTDANNRAIGGLPADLFTVTESGIEREIVSVETSSAPFNLVLLLDVSGSIQNYVDFIRKAARSFVETVDERDKVAIITFRGDIQLLSGFSTDTEMLSESLDSFDSGGPTAFYDALGYVLADTLEPLKGERCAIVALSDGEDNRSFLSFSALLGSLQESGALVYPLYVPAGVAARGAGTEDSSSAADPLRDKLLSFTLSEKAQDEGEALARISGGVYYPITRLSELQKAYDDIVKQLRTAYTIRYRSGSRGDGSPPRVRVKVDRDGAFVRYADSTLR